MKDLFIAIIIGLLIAVFFIPVAIVNNWPVVWVWWGFLVFPAIAFFGILGSFWVGKLVKPIPQITRFAGVGVLNTLVDFGILDLFILFIGFGWGVYSFTIYKTISFIIANLNSYFWNKYWTFKDTSRDYIKEYTQFLVVSLVALLLNVGIASGITLYIHPLFNMRIESWSNLAALIGGLATFIWNFFGYKLIVFKK